MFTLDADSFQKHLKDFVDLHKINAELEKLDKSSNNKEAVEMQTVAAQLEDNNPNSSNGE